MITIPLSLLIMHFIGDFLLQSDWMAVNKSKSTAALGLHCLIYALCFLPWGIEFAFWTFVLHVNVDAITSRITSKLWFLEMEPITDSPYCKVCANWSFVCNVKPTRHWFFVVIGLDQLIHYGCLAWTLKLLTP